MATYGDLNVSTINGVGIGTKNAIINGGFGINQRVVSGTVTLAAGVYGHDRWKAGSSGCTYTFATVDNVTTLTISAGSLIQVIEGLNLQSGTYTLSWTGTAQGKIGVGSYGASGITGTAVGGTNLNIEFNTGTVSLVQLEKGSTATPFEFRSYGQELALCQRYLPVWSCAVNQYFATGYSYSTNAGLLVLPTPVQTRVAPTGITASGNFTALYGNLSTAAVSSLVFSTSSQSNVGIVANTAGAYTAGGAISIYASSTSSTIFGTGCEL